MHKLRAAAILLQEVHELKLWEINIYEKTSTTQNPIQVRTVIHKVSKKRIVVT